MAKKRANNTDELTPEQRKDLRYSWTPTAFASESDRRAAWETHRESLMAESHAGRRPHAYWQYDQPEINAKRMGLETDVQLLWRFGLLTAAEIAELEAAGARSWPIRPCLGLTAKQILEDNLDWSAILGVY
jgi:hypothetical protein